jgi:hypothetical protein
MVSLERDFVFGSPSYFEVFSSPKDGEDSIKDGRSKAIAPLLLPLSLSLPTTYIIIASVTELHFRGGYGEGLCRQAR